MLSHLSQKALTPILDHILIETEKQIQKFWCFFLSLSNRHSPTLVLIYISQKDFQIKSIDKQNWGLTGRSSFHLILPQQLWVLQGVVPIAWKKTFPRREGLKWLSRNWSAGGASLHSRPCDHPVASAKPNHCHDSVISISLELSADFRLHHHSQSMK